MRFFLFSLLSWLFISCKNISHSNQGYNGKWEWRNSSGNSFDLTIFQKGDSIKGRHCAIFYNGNKIDCTFDKNEYTIFGKVAGDSANIFFISTFSFSKGKAVLKRKADYVEWKIIQKPKGEYYIPTFASLRSVTSE